MALRITQFAGTTILRAVYRPGRAAQVVLLLTVAGFLWAFYADDKVDGRIPLMIFCGAVLAIPIMKTFWKQSVRFNHSNRSVELWSGFGIEKLQRKLNPDQVTQVHITMETFRPVDASSDGPGHVWYCPTLYLRYGDGDSKKVQCLEFEKRADAHLAAVTLAQLSAVKAFDEEGREIAYSSEASKDDSFQTK